MAISSSGIGSGLDVNLIVSQLMSAERAPIATLKARQSTYNAKLSAYGTLKSTLDSLKTTLKGLDGQGMAARSVTSSNDKVLGASVGSGAVPGTYAIEVSTLAQQHKLMSPGFADAKAALGNGSLTLQVGGADPITLPAADYTLQGLSNAINTAKAGVSATIINDGTESHLVITAHQSGKDNTVKITATGGLSAFEYDAETPPAPGTGMEQKQAALDAQFTIDGIPVSSASNKAADAIQGLTLNLSKTNVGEAVTLTVENDKTAVKGAIKTFVDAYNKLNSTVRSMTSYNATAQSGAVLNGDTGASSIITGLRKELTASVSGAGSLSSLSSIGIAFQRDGSLAIDDAKLQKAMDSSFDDVAALFSGTDGYTARLTAATTSMLGTGGVIASRTEGLNSSIRSLTDRQADMEVLLAQTEKRYRAQFTALDSMMNSMQSTSNFLAQQLASLSNNS